MIKEQNELSEKYYPILEKFFNGSKSSKLAPVYFKKSIWQFVFLYKKEFSIVFLLEGLLHVFLTLLPLSLVNLISLRRIDYFIYFAIAWLFFVISPYFNMKIYARITAEIMQSVYYAAVKFFLTVDPIFHSTKSSGQIIAKVNRGSEAYEDLFDIFLFNILQISITLITAISAIFYINFKSGLVALFSIIIIGIFSTYVKHFSNEVLVSAEIEADDSKKATGLENLSLNNYIRATFATAEQDKKMKNKALKMVAVLKTVWMGNITLDIMTRFLYVVSFSILGFVVMNQVANSQLELIPAAGIFLAYFQGAGGLWTIGRSVQKFTDRMKRIQDLFDFIRGFGKQTYPVLPSNNTSIDS